jgi:hypothetical protein
MTRGCLNANKVESMVDIFKRCLSSQTLGQIHHDPQSTTRHGTRTQPILLWR